jgi:hypothetical protein
MFFMLTILQAGYGNPEEMSSHMDAIERIVKLRGGLRRFQDDGPMIEKLKLYGFPDRSLKNSLTMSQL